MSLNAPTTIVFLISLIVIALAVVGQFTAIPFISENGFWAGIVGYGILAVGNLLKGV